MVCKGREIERSDRSSMGIENSAFRKSEIEYRNKLRTGKERTDLKLSSYPKYLQLVTVTVEPGCNVLIP